MWFLMENNIRCCSYFAFKPEVVARKEAPVPEEAHADDSEFQHDLEASELEDLGLWPYLVEALHFWVVEAGMVEEEAPTPP